MNFISWNTKPSIINEQTQNYLSDVRLDEATEIGKLVAPMANKMKNIKVNGQKVKVGEPYRDTRLFFLNYLKDEYPELVPDGFKAYSAAHVHKLIGEIAMNSPEKLKDIFDNFKDWSETKVLAGDGKEVDRMTQYINTKATLRQGKGVRQTRDAEAATGGTKRDFKKLKVDDISSASKEKEKEEQLKASKEKIDNVEGMMSNDAAGEAISIIPNLMNVLNFYHGEIEEMDLSPDGFESQLQILKNVTDVAPSLRTLSKYKEFVNYLGQLRDGDDEYGEIRQHLADQIPNIEADIARFAETEDNEHEQKKPDFLDFDGDGDKTESMEKALADVVKQKALQRAIEKEEEEVADHYKDGESLVGKEAILDHNRSVMVIDHDGDRFVFVQDKDGRELKVPLSRLDFTASSENEESNPREYTATTVRDNDQGERAEDVRTFPKSRDGLNAAYKFVQGANDWMIWHGDEVVDRSGDEENSTSQYMPNVPAHEQRKEEAEEVRMSQLEINQHLAVQERQRVQNLYAQQRRNTHGY